MSTQLKVMDCPTSTSEDPAPLSVTCVPTVVAWSGPAFATGAMLFDDTVTEPVALSEPSDTCNWTTYVPLKSATKLGVAMFALLKVAALPTGREMKLHKKERASPFGSLDAAPVRFTV
jgi:hypothetical protein